MQVAQDFSRIADTYMEEVSYMRGWICEVSQEMFLDMECGVVEFCKYKVGLKLTTRNLKWDIEKNQVLLRLLLYLSLQTSSLKNVESNLTLT